MQPLSLMRLILLTALTACASADRSTSAWVDKALTQTEGNHFEPRLMRLGHSLVAFVESRPSQTRDSVPWLFVHGMAGRWEDATKVMELAARDHHVVALDLPGFGRSLSLRSEYTIQGYADLLRDFLAAGGLRKVHLICHSVGGQICLTLSLSDPLSVQSLTLIDPAGTYNQSAYVENLARTHGGLNTGNIYAKGGTALADLNWYDQAFVKRMISSNPVFLITVESFKSNLRSRLRYLRSPTLIIWGQNDPVFPVENAFDLKENIPGAKLYVVEQAGHSPHMSHPDLVYRWVTAFHHTHGSR